MQVLGSCCFITAALLFMLETQPSWWHIKPFDLGWHVGFWNLIGGLGFWLWCDALLALLCTALLQRITMEEHNSLHKAAQQVA